MLTTTQLQKLMNYQKLQALRASGIGLSQISRELGVSRRTLYKWLSQPDFENWVLTDSQHRRSKLSDYEHFVKTRLERCPSASSAQIRDWLLEHHDNLPDVCEKTFYNFTQYIRKKYSIVKESPRYRSYQAVPTLNYGKQAQVDFGQDWLEDQDGNRHKVYFFAMVLSRSRYKYIYFQEQPFTSETSIIAHEHAFAYYQGVPNEIVYDQDRVFVVSENKGAIIYTQAFSAYLKSRKFKVYLCRKADPESKGKIENVVGYVKGNFLHGRLFEGIDLLNQAALAWLERTGNGRLHNGTGQIPSEEFKKEEPHLQAFTPLSAFIPYTYRQVRKDNLICFQGNFYSVPLGTYQDHPKVIIDSDREWLYIYSEAHEELARHLIVAGKHQQVIAESHLRNSQYLVLKLIENLSEKFSNSEQAKAYLTQVAEKWNRYAKGQLNTIEKALQKYSSQIIERTLSFCREQRVYSGTDFNQIARYYELEQTSSSDDLPDTQTSVIDLNKNKDSWATITPQKTDIETFEQFFK